MSLQEKFQITIPAKEQQPKRSEKWEDWCNVKTSEANRDKHGVAPVKTWDRLNIIPGVNIDDQVTTNMPLSMAGKTDVSDHVSGNFEKGYSKLEMKGTDDQYTGEHTDLFYGDAGGFVERNNYMDRE